MNFLNIQEKEFGNFRIDSLPFLNDKTFTFTIIFTFARTFTFTNYHFSKQNLQALLSNYNPGLALSPAAKQIELDLLRTLPSNKHYDSPHASGYHPILSYMIYPLHRY